jgi:elongation factor P--(R)-beta-lysine ligase
LAKVVRGKDGYDVAERFELYYRGIELANGFHELGDAAELRKRFEAVNASRVADGRRVLPLPERLLAAIERGLPDCTGVALGFDRLAMLASGAELIDGVLAFPQELA